jgi:hypothetical protein
MHAQAISRIETGTNPLYPGWRTRIAAALDVSEATLIQPDMRPIPQANEIPL